MLAPAVVIAAAPALWVLFDLLLTGDPLHSLTGTQALAEELGPPDRGAGRASNSFGSSPICCVRPSS